MSYQKFTMGYFLENKRVALFVTQEQLLKRGIDKFGNRIVSKSTRKLGVYSYNYGLRKRKFERIDTFNLKLTGKLHSSFDLKPNNDNAILYAKTIKNGYDIRKKYAAQMQFSNESINEILHNPSQYTKKSLVNYIRKMAIKNFKT